METRFELGRERDHLWTRALGKQLRVALEDHLANAATGDVVVVDLAGVQAFDYSFANEFFGRSVMTLSREYPGRFLVVEHMEEDTREDLEQALKSLGLIMVAREHGQLGLIGRVHPVDAQTFAAIIELGEPATAVTLKDRLSINLTTMNERLSKLTEAGVVRRERVVSPVGREQFQYWRPT